MKEILEALNKAVEAGTLTAEEVESLKGKFEESYIKKDSLTESYISKEEFNEKLKSRLDREKSKYKEELEELEEAKSKLEKLEEYQLQLEAATAKLQGYEKEEKEKSFNSQLDEKLKELLGDKKLDSISEELLRLKIGSDYENEELITNSVQEVVTKFKEANQIFTGGIGTGSSELDYENMSYEQLFEIGRKQ